MRTKTLLLTAALAAAGVVTSVAQTVYSVNAVGYVNVVFKPGFQMIANPLNAPTNTVKALIPSVPNNSTLYKFNNATGTYTINNFLFGNWGNPNDTLVPGEGAFLRLAGTSDVTNTFVGEVVTGDTVNPIPAGFSIKSSIVPQSGALDSVLGFPNQNNDNVYLFRTATQTYQTFTYLFGSYGANPPVPAVGESFFVRKNTAQSWNRTFNVNQ